MLSCVHNTYGIFCSVFPGSTGLSRELPCKCSMTPTFHPQSTDPEVGTRSQWGPSSPISPATAGCSEVSTHIKLCQQVPDCTFGLGTEGVRSVSSHCWRGKLMPLFLPHGESQAAAWEVVPVVKGSHLHPGHFYSWSLQFFLKFPERTKNV